MGKRQEDQAVTWTLMGTLTEQGGEWTIWPVVSGPVAGVSTAEPPKLIGAAAEEAICFVERATQQERHLWLKPKDENGKYCLAIDLTDKLRRPADYQFVRDHFPELFIS